LSWTIVGEDGSRRVPAPSEQVQDKQLTLNMNESGTYSVELTVQDTSRNTVFVRENFTVENIRPLAAISVNGLMLEDEQTLILESKNDWILNGSQSLDNEPVDYLWVIDDTYSIRGTPVLGPSDFPSTGLHTVELIVFDDDGATHSTIVQVEIQGEDSVVEQSNIVGATVVCLMLLVLFGVLWTRKAEASSTSLPKWNKPDTINDEETYRFDTSINATVEEEKPRG
jgi:archaellum component FlaF (FlaF/FlaG flagellin family)